MAQFVYENPEFHCLCFLLGFHPECSLSNSLSCFDLWNLFCVRLRACAQAAMAPVVRVEPNDMKLPDSNPELLARVEVVGWFPFIRKFTDSNPEVTRLFALSLDNSRVKIADLRFKVDERSMALSTGLPLTGERWFKYKQMEVTEWRKMLKNPCQDVSFRTGVSQKYFKKEWQPVLDIIHRYVTCEGRLSLAYIYHLRLMAVFISFPLNLPHYLV